MAEQEKIKLTQLLEACLDFTRDPTPANELKITEITKDFVIREYLPLSEKQAQLTLIVGSIPDEGFNAFTAETWLTINKVLFGILAYVTNLEYDLDLISSKPVVVDLLYQTGVIDLVLEHASKDFERLDKMISEAINFSNIFRIAETASLFSQDKIEEFVKEVRSLKQELTPEALKDLKAIVAAGSPELKALKETVVEQAVGNVMEADFDKLEEDKKEEKPAEEKAEA